MTIKTLRYLEPTGYSLRLQHIFEAMEDLAKSERPEFTIVNSEHLVLAILETDTTNSRDEVVSALAKLGVTPETFKAALADVRTKARRKAATS